MTPLSTLHTSLESARVRFGSCPGLLRPPSAQRTVARPSVAVTRVQASAAIPQQAVCFSSGSRLQTNNSSKSAEAKEQALQQLMVELLPELEPLGVTPQLLRKVLTCNNRGSLMTAITAHQLKDRFKNIYQLAAADTKEQRALVNKQLGQCPVLLDLQASHVAAHATGLRDILWEQFNVPPTTVQQLITMQLSLLRCKPQSVADKLQGWASMLQLDAASVVQDIWCKNAGMQSIFRPSTATVAAAFQQLQSVLQLAADDVVQMVLSRPNLLSNTSEDKLHVLSQLLDSYNWTQQLLGQALLTYPNVLTRSVDSLNLIWQVIHQYAEAHPPSKQQFQDKCRSRAFLCMFNIPANNLKLMQYIVQYHEQPEQQQDTRPAASSAHVSHRSNQQSGACRRRQKQRRVVGYDSSATASMSNDAGLPCPHQDRPMVWKFTAAQRDKLAKLAADYPGFWNWLKQQQG